MASLFQGYDTFTNSIIANTAVDGTQSTPQDGSETCNINVCTSYSDVQSVLNISGAASATYGGDSVDTKTTFLQTLQISTYTVTVIVYSCSSNTVSGSNASLNSGVSTSDLDAFCAEYGDSYLSSLTTGGEYMAAYVFYAQSEEEQTSVVSSLSACGVSGSATTQASLTEATTNITTSQYFNQMITGNPTAAVPAPDDVVQFALDFASTVTITEPAVISFSTMGYETAGATNFAPVVANRNLFLGTSTTPGLSSDYASLSAVWNQIQQINAIYKTYGYTLDTALNQSVVYTNTSTPNANQVNADMTSLSTLINDINGNPAGTYTAGTYPSLAYGTPQLNFLWAQSPAWGTNGGGQFQDFTPQSIDGQIQAQWIPQSLTLYGGEYVNELQITYSLVQTPGTPTGTPPVTTTTTCTHGQQGGSWGPDSLDLPAGDFITSIGGSCGEYVNQLTFTTSGGDKLESGGSGGSSFSWSVPAPDPATSTYSVVVGFQGWAGDYLNQLQAIYCTFSPATWSGSA